MVFPVSIEVTQVAPRAGAWIETYLQALLSVKICHPTFCHPEGTKSPKDLFRSFVAPLLRMTVEDMGLILC